MQIKTTYQKPEVEVVYIRTGSQLLDASFPGDHHKGEHNRPKSRAKEPRALSSGAAARMYRHHGKTKTKT